MGVRRSLLVGLVALGLVLTPLAPATADSAVFGQPANVGGTVVDPEGVGISGVPIVLEFRSTYDAEWGFLAQTTTAADGSWSIPVSFLNPPPSGYRVSVLTTATFVPVSPRFAGEENFYVIDNDQPINFTLTRFGRATGALLNAGDGLSGLIEVRVWDGTGWGAPAGGGIGILTSSSTTYEVSGLQVGQRYAVRFSMNDGSRYATTWSNSSTAAPSGPTEPGTFGISEAGEIIDGPDVTLERLVAISGVVMADGAPVDGATVSAEEVGGAGSFEQTSTAADGSYTLFVPGGATYRVYAFIDDYLTQVFDGVNVCCQFTPLVLTDTDASGIDFSLLAEDDAIIISLELYTIDDAAMEEQSFGDRAVLYRAVTGGWEQVAAVQAADDSSFVEFVQTAPGQYKVRFQDGDTMEWLPVREALGATVVDGGCSLSFGDMALGTADGAEVLLDRRTAAPSCGPEPAPTPPSGGTPPGTTPPGSTPPGSTAPRVPAPTTPVDLAALLAAPVNLAAEAEADESSNGAGTADDQGGPADGPSSDGDTTDGDASESAPGGGADLTWLAWVLGGGVILVLVVTAITLMRRRA